MLPLLAVTYEHLFREDRGETTLKQKNSRYAGLWVVLFTYLFARYHVLGSLTLRSKRANVSLYQVVLSAVSLTGKYVGKFFWPVHLDLFYNFHKSSSLFQTEVLLGLLALGACAIVVLWDGIHSPASFCVIWFLVTLAPVLNLRWIVTYAFAERYAYLPSVGLCWLLGYGVSKLWTLLANRPLVWRLVFASALVAVASLCALKTIRQNPAWLDQETLIKRTLAASSDANFFHANLGGIYWNEGNVEAAEREWNEGLKTDPDNYIVLEDLGLVSAKQGRIQEAQGYFNQVETQHPNYTHIYLTSGAFYEQLGQLADAEAQYRMGTRLAPLNVEMRNRLGALLLKEGRPQEAEQQFRQSVDVDPTAAACDALGDIYSKQRDEGAAKESFKQGLSLEPFDSHAHFGLAAAYAAQGSSADARREYELGLRTDPFNADALAMLQQIRQ